MVSHLGSSWYPVVTKDIEHFLYSVAICVSSFVNRLVRPFTRVIADLQVVFTYLPRVYLCMYEPLYLSGTWGPSSLIFLLCISQKMMLAILLVFSILFPGA